MDVIGDIVLKYGLGAAAIVAITWIAVKLINYITGDLSGKIDSLYEIIKSLVEEIRRK